MLKLPVTCWDEHFCPIQTEACGLNSLIPHTVWMLDHVSAAPHTYTHVSQIQYVRSSQITWTGRFFPPRRETSRRYAFCEMTAWHLCQWWVSELIQVAEVNSQTPKDTKEDREIEVCAGMQHIKEGSRYTKLFSNPSKEKLRKGWNTKQIILLSFSKTLKSCW